MFRRSEPVPATDPQIPLTTDQPHDTCFRCGQPTPLGVSLCERDNPGRIKGPSSTQVHGTIVVGVLFGFIGLLLIFRLATPGAAAVSSAVSGAATRPDGGVDVVVTVTNSGTTEAAASCVVSPGGAPDYQDYVFFTGPIPGGETRTFARTLPAPGNGRSLSASAVAIRCS